jgi:hypothetical protein
MSYSHVFKQSWRAVWSLRTLWIFGFLLALTSSGGAWWLFSLDSDNISQEGITIQLPGGNTWYTAVGAGLKIDLTTPGDPRILIQSDNRWVELNELTWPEIDLALDNINITALLIFLAVEAGILILLTILLRYTSESAIIRGVNFNAQGGEKPGFGYSLRQGWSRTAGRLFLIDLLIFLVVAGGMLVALMASLAPLFLWNSDSTTAGIFGTGLSLLLLVPWTFLLILIIPITSLLREIFWRACAFGELGVWASIGRGFATLRHNFVEVLVIWLIWLATGVLWMLVLIPLVIILSPLLALTVLMGAILGVIPGLLVAAISSLFFSGVTAWIMGALAALPIFLAAVFAPITLLSGFVRLFQSNLWTLAYRQLPVLKPVEAANAALPTTQQGKPAVT